ncbi:hypothetical protein C8J57DRAFT_1716926 [Mycena rebaudengoi]|nr:hypothetical protein C8J57DRAFT_1716926 [Mycena rebaudengoi]
MHEDMRATETEMGQRCHHHAPLTPRRKARNMRAREGCSRALELSCATPLAKTRTMPNHRRRRRQTAQIANTHAQHTTAHAEDTLCTLQGTPRHPPRDTTNPVPLGKAAARTHAHRKPASREMCLWCREHTGAAPYAASILMNAHSFSIVKGLLWKNSRQNRKTSFGHGSYNGDDDFGTGLTLRCKVDEATVVQGRVLQRSCDEPGISAPNLPSPSLNTVLASPLDVPVKNRTNTLMARANSAFPPGCLSAIVLIHEKGSVSTFKNVWKKPRHIPF